MTTTDLADGERFLVTSSRRWALGLSDNNGDHWRFVWHDFQNRMGAHDGKAALASFAAMVAALHLHARRPLRHHHPCCPCVGSDEIYILAIVAACQWHDAGLAKDAIVWLVQKEGARRVLESSEALAAVMRLHGVDIPLRVRASTPESEAPAFSQVGVRSMVGVDNRGDWAHGQQSDRRLPVRGNNI